MVRELPFSVPCRGCGIYHKSKAGKQLSLLSVCLVRPEQFPAEFLLLVCSEASTSGAGANRSGGTSNASPFSDAGNSSRLFEKAQAPPEVPQASLEEEATSTAGTQIVLASPCY